MYTVRSTLGFSPIIWRLPYIIAVFSWRRWRIALIHSLIAVCSLLLSDCQTNECTTVLQNCNKDRETAADTIITADKLSTASTSNANSFTLAFWNRYIEWYKKSKTYYDINKTAELSQRRPRDAPNIWVPRMCIQDLKFVALPVPEIIGGTPKIWAVPGYAHAPFSPKILKGFCSDGPFEYTCQIWSS